MSEKRFTSIHPINLWRAGNAIILLLALLLPWTVHWTDIAPYSVGYTNGWDVLFFPKTLMAMRPSIDEMLPSRFLPMLGWSLIRAAVPITAIGYSVFCIMAVLRGTSGALRWRKKSIWILFIFLLVAYPLWHTSYGVGFHNKLSWGYYLVIFGFISSALLELYSVFWIRDKQINRRVQPEVPEAG